MYTVRHETICERTCKHGFEVKYAHTHQRVGPVLKLARNTKRVARAYCIYNLKNAWEPGGSGCHARHLLGFGTIPRILSGMERPIEWV